MSMVLTQSLMSIKITTREENRKQKNIKNIISITFKNLRNNIRIWT